MDKKTLSSFCSCFYFVYNESGNYKSGVWLCLGKPSLGENPFTMKQKWMMFKDVEVILGSDKEDRLCLFSFQIWGMVFSFLGRMSGDNW